MLAQLRDNIEIIIVVNADDIEKNKVRADLGITYDEDALRLRDEFMNRSFMVGSIVITHYNGQHAADQFRHRLERMGVKSYFHYPIDGYPHNVELIASDEGFGKNEFVETSRPLVIVTAPGHGSGKMATCLSQLYNENKRGVRAGYAKFETFTSMESAPEASCQHRLRGSNCRSERCEYDRPIPPGGIRQDNRKLQPRRRNIPQY